ncbi:HEAT repeat domain-containing protein [Serratia marcescens]|uniref:HEAT repeat domain-containing protein n=1 Tax=Serratia TaxID=613 RepID=UPI0018AA10EF|nr:HEAT repeat domain-containing protein [Serratia ureilytica]MBH2614640.1 HEAT repeat domain-containing protein [Serratia ureilytica]MBH3236799.1 HEAT repeat domain-containing protein [Serratia marcescens]MBJ2103829.1 HEAT repeat domain-containing protein [Serratia ureilytica]MBN5385937.1 HEAT repeat domain-containing protein [Serratia ureilytica]
MLPNVSARLLELTRDLNNQVKIAAIYALGEGGVALPAITERLLELSNDLNNDVKIAATKALGRMSRPGE